MRYSKGEAEADDFCPKWLAVPSSTLFFNLIFKSVVISTAQPPTAKASLRLSDDEEVICFSQDKSNTRYHYHPRCMGCPVLLSQPACPKSPRGARLAQGGW